MKIKISRNIRKYIIIYLAVLLALYLVIELVPRVTDIFETTEILEPGSVMLTTEATGYLIKNETINVSSVNGPIEYLVEEGTPVRNKQEVVRIYDTGEGGEVSGKYEDLVKQLNGYTCIKEGTKTPISGIFSLHMDGGEQALSPEHMDELTKKELKDLSLNDQDMRENEVAVGDPIFKITNDNKWYVVCWLKKDDISNYQEGQAVNLALPEGTVAATIRSIDKEKKKLFKVIFYCDRYYRDLATAREVKMTIQDSDRSGLLIDNVCLIEKDGKQGVYVRNKNGNYYFVQVNVIETDGKESVISESSFINEKGQQVYTVSVYDEVLKQPKKQLKKELREREKKQKSTGG